MDKNQAFAFLEELQGQGIKLGLSRIRRFLKHTGNPEKNFRSVHVAGTNGKGSTSAMIESALRKAGYKTALYTSPHLIRFNERIQVNGNPISDSRLAILVSRLREEMQESGIRLTYFEFITALAFRHFSDSGVEAAVIEVGMGGRLDATNVITPMVSVITNVENEHEQHLGKTLPKIAFEKAGIIKKGVPVVTAEQKEPVLRVFRKKSRQADSRLVLVKKPVKKRLALLGSFQQWNAALALAALKQLQAQGLELSEKSIEEGLASAKWPGRFQIMRKKPLLIVDCAHNPACCSALSAAFRAQFPGKKALLVIGVSSDKKVKAMAQRLSPLCKKAFVTGASFRAMPLEKVASAFSVLGKPVEPVPGVPNAVRKALSAAGPKDIVLVAGSCFVAGEALSFLKKRQ